MDTVNEKLRGTKRIDLFQSARVDPKVPIEESIKALVELKNEGKIDHIGMSECCAKTLRHGNMVSPSDKGLRPLLISSRDSSHKRG